MLVIVIVEETADPEPKVAVDPWREMSRISLAILANSDS
jgi:hypothetical protein